MKFYTGAIMLVNVLTPKLSENFMKIYFIIMPHNLLGSVLSLKYKILYWNTYTQKVHVKGWQIWEENNEVFSSPTNGVGDTNGTFKRRGSEGGGRSQESPGISTFLMSEFPSLIGVSLN